MSKINNSEKNGKVNIYFEEENQSIIAILPSGIFFETENGIQFIHRTELDEADIADLNEFTKYLSVDSNIKLIGINEDSLKIEINGEELILTEYVVSSENGIHTLYLSTPSMYHLELNQDEWIELVNQQKDILFKDKDFNFIYPGDDEFKKEALLLLMDDDAAVDIPYSEIDIDSISANAIIETVKLDRDVHGYDYALKVFQDDETYMAFVNEDELNSLETRILIEKTSVGSYSETMSAIDFVNYGSLAIKKVEDKLILVDSKNGDNLGDIKFIPSTISENSTFNIIVQKDDFQISYPVVADKDFVENSDISFKDGVSENLSSYTEGYVKSIKNVEDIECKIVDLDYNGDNNRVVGRLQVLAEEKQFGGIPDSFDLESKRLTIKGISYPVEIDDAKWEAMVQSFRENNLIESKNLGELVQVPIVENDKLVHITAIRDYNNNLFGINDDRVLKFDAEAGYSIIKENDDSLKIIYLKEIPSYTFKVSNIDSITLIDTANNVVVYNDEVVHLSKNSMKDLLSHEEALSEKLPKQGTLLISGNIPRSIDEVQSSEIKTCSLSFYPAISDVQFSKTPLGVVITGKLDNNEEFSSRLESINVNSNNGNKTLNITTNEGTFNIVSFGENKEFNVEKISNLQKEVAQLVSESKELKQIFINDGNLYAKFNNEYLCLNKPGEIALEGLSGKTTCVQVSASQYNEIVDVVSDGATKFTIVKEDESNATLIFGNINDNSISGHHKISMNIVDNSSLSTENQFSDEGHEVKGTDNVEKVVEEQDSPALNVYGM